jgi:hypothetical protein
VLWDFKQVQKRLAANALKPIEKVDLSTNVLKRKSPPIDTLRSGSFSLCSSQSFHERRHVLAHSCSVETLGQSRGTALGEACPRVDRLDASPTSPAA